MPTLPFGAPGAISCVRNIYNEMPLVAVWIENDNKQYTLRQSHNKIMVCRRHAYKEFFEDGNIGTKVTKRILAILQESGSRDISKRNVPLSGVTTVQIRKFLRILIMYKKMAPS